MICVPRKVDGGYIGELYQGLPYKTCGASGWIIPGTDLTSSIPVFEELPPC